MVNKKRAGLALLLVLVFGCLMAGCSTYPKSKLVVRDTTYDVLGFVEGPFRSYQEALAAAKEIYPEANGIILLKSTLKDRLLPKGTKLGYLVIQFKAEEPPPPRKKFLGLF